jgi:acyl-coenzyme A thioesterase PaaI-like protein
MPERQPNSLNCFVCGVQNPVGLRLAFYATAPDEVTVHYTAPKHYEGFPGILHGGIVASILDEAGGRAAMADDPNRFMFTAKLEVKYRQPTPIETPLVITGKMIKLRDRLAMTHAEIRIAADNTLCAEADLTLALVEALTQFTPEQLAELGWKVYEENEQ